MFNFRKQSGTELFEKGKTYHQVQKYNKSLSYFVKAHETGHVESRNYIGTIYYNGLGLTQDYSTALFWFKLAGENGDAESQRKVGEMYYDGKVGGTPDYQKVMEWFYKSVNNGNFKACKLIGLVFLKEKER
ncbi:hypothetical protein MFLAVUS_004297 [Mucor flavus]|uniref:Sel1 repeat family protein n=1 Tax=Mucor flavus TaxID=439312 RepID=A0ABP9YVH9_9FUNG